MAAWLRSVGDSHDDTTILMPLKEKDKCPVFPHARKKWEWGDVDAFAVRSPKWGTWGLLLDGLCVVDADDAEAVDFLEALGESGEEPAIKTCAVQITRKGRHYVFKRPKLADELGFYDGARQVGRPNNLEIDLKTRCSTGTRGVLAIQPSENKKWMQGRAPWEVGELPEITESLLRKVAQPRHEARGKGIGGGPPTSTAATSRDPPTIGRTQTPTQPSSSTAAASVNDPVVRLLGMLSKTRWDSYTSWRDIACLIKNVDSSGNRYLAEFDRLSRISSRYDDGCVQKLWASVGNDGYQGPRLGMGSLHRWAKNDDPYAYQAFRASVIPPAFFDYIHDGDRGLADIAAHVLKDAVKRSGRGEVFYYNDREARWYEAEGERDLWSKLSRAVEEALRDVDAALAAKANAAETNKEREEIDEARKVVAARIATIKSYAGFSKTTTAALPLLADPGFADNLDSVPYLVGVKNGVVDLRTGQLRQRTPEDFVMNVLDVEYSPSTDTTFVEDTVKAMMAGDEEMTRFMQKLLGYAITGETREELFVILTASGRNGKGLLMQALQSLLGNFYKEMDVGVLVPTRKISNVGAEKAKMRGGRIVVFNELEPSEKLSTQMLKVLSGGDGVPVAQKYKDPVTIKPRHQCFLTTNNLPDIDQVDVAISERLVVVEFPVTFVDLVEGEGPSARRQQRDCGLKKKMEENKAALLRWLVEGSVRWYAQGGIKRDAPERVKAFSRNYLVEQDLFASFLRDRCRVEAGARVRTVEFKDAFNDWLRADGQKIWSDKAIAAAMRAKGFEKKNALVAGAIGVCFWGVVVEDRV